jgi:hypothetical protein
MRKEGGLLFYGKKHKQKNAPEGAPLQERGRSRGRQIVVPQQKYRYGAVREHQGL